MSTVDDDNQLQKPSADGGGENQDDEVKDFKFYCKPENAYTILEKRWGIFTLTGFVVYSYHFVMCIWGVDQYCHFTRFLSSCTTPTDMSEKYVDNSAIFDGAILAVTVFHMIEWIRQWVFLTSVLVGINWISVYYVMSINIPFGLLASLIGFIIAMGAETCLCEVQKGRAFYLQLQILTFFLYIMWCQMHIVMFKFNNAMFSPKPDAETGECEYDSWVQAQFEAEDEDDD